MKQRTMVKISAEENIISLRTVSRAYRSTQRFMILRRKLEELKEKKKVIVSDIHSFAVLRLYKTPGGLDVIDFDFSWLSDDGYGRLSGQAETVRLSYETFMARIEESSRLGGQPRNLLSIPEDSRPRIEFESRRNLQEVAKNKRIRRIPKASLLRMIMSRTAFSLRRRRCAAMEFVAVLFCMGRII